MLIFVIMKTIIPEKTNNQLFTIPNIVSLFRIILVGIAAYCLAKGDNINAFIIYVTAMLTDFLDGFLARLLQQISELGKILDPLADKLMVISAVVILCIQGRMPIWFVSIVLARDLIIMIAGLILRSKLNFVIPSIMIGKITATVLMLTFGLNILYFYYIEYLYYLSALLSLISLIAYAVNANKILKNKTNKANE